MLDMPQTLTMQRARGRAHLGFECKGGKTKLTDLYQSGCVKALIPRNHAGRTDAVLINTAGGVTGGDQLDYSADLSQSAQLCLTTQTAERIYKSLGDYGRIDTTFTLEENAALDWLPQETILFEQAALKRKITIDMDNSASALILEPIVMGRKAMGETVQECFMSDHWRITRGGRLAYADALRINDPTALSGAATLGGNRAFATLVYVAPDAESRLDQMRALLNFEAVSAATSAWNGCLVTRFIAADAQPLRAALISTLTQFRAHPLPRVWHM